MSKRTGEAAKAIREAWKREQQLVFEGKGTRDWTPEEQQSIIDEGKAYDENGKAYIGHHMKSAECYPEYQGDPENIQFLTYIEHQKAHDGDWRSPSNWYYDPVTEIKYDFGENKYIPCETIELSMPLSISTPDEPIKETIPVNNRSIQEQLPQNSIIEGNEGNLADNPEVANLLNLENASKRKTGIWEKTIDLFETAAEKIHNFSEDHPVISGLAKESLKMLGEVVLESVTSESSYSDNSKDKNHSPDLNSHEKIEINSPDRIPAHYPIERSSPIKHDVSGYDRLQHGKTVHVKPYKRGKR